MNKDEFKIVLESVDSGSFFVRVSGHTSESHILCVMTQAVVEVMKKSNLSKAQMMEAFEFAVDMMIGDTANTTLLDLSTSDPEKAVHHESLIDNLVKNMKGRG